MIRAYKPDLGIMIPDPDAKWVPRDDLETALAENKVANARERPAFMAGVEVGLALEGIDRCDYEQEWQQYRCQDDSDWRAARGVLADPERVSTVPAPECDHSWFKPADNEHIQWGEYVMCSKCHEILAPDTAGTEQTDVCPETAIEKDTQ